MGRCASISKSEQVRTVAKLQQSNQPHRNTCLLILGIETGLRISELLSLTVGDLVDVSGRVKRVAVIQKKHVKGGKNSRQVRLSPSARDAVYLAVTESFGRAAAQRDSAMFSPCFRRGSISRRQAYNIISGALRRAGIEHTHGTHTMRKTRAQRVVNCAVDKFQRGETQVLPIMAAKAALGHADIRTTERYLKSGIEEVDTWTMNGEI